MATFCGKCGASVSPETQFCSACGAPTAAGVPMAAPPVVSYGQPVPVQQSSGGGVAKVILIVIGVVFFIGLCIAGVFAFTVWRVSRAVHIDDKNGQVTVHTSEGTMTTNTEETYTPAELGTDIYPGATTGRGGMKMDLPTGSMVTGVFVTSDSKEQVLAYYKGKLGSGASVIDSSNGAIVSLNKGNQESVMVTISTKTSDNDGKTQIAIVHTKSNKSVVVSVEK